MREEAEAETESVVVENVVVVVVVVEVVARELMVVGGEGEPDELAAKDGKKGCDKEDVDMREKKGGSQSSRKVDIIVVAKRVMTTRERERKRGMTHIRKPGEERRWARGWRRWRR